MCLFYAAFGILSQNKKHNNRLGIRNDIIICFLFEKTKFLKTYSIAASFWLCLFDPSELIKAFSVRIPVTNSQ